MNTDERSREEQKALMNLEPTDEQRALRDTVRRYFAEHASIAGHVRPMLADPTGTTSATWQGLAELGATGVLVPSEYGGTGMSMVDTCIVAEEAGAALFPGPWLSSAVAAPRAIARFAAEPAAADLLAAIAGGTAIATVAPLVESAVDVVDGPAGATLHGEFDVADAAAADVVLAIVEDHDRSHLYVLETASEGLELELLPGIDQTRKIFRARMDDASARLLGSAERGARVAMVDDVLVASAADALGAAQRLVDTVVEYAKSRAQFGQPIGSFQSVAHLCVDMYETVELTRSGVIHAAWAADEADADELHLAALRLKGFAARLAAVGDTAIQVLGGIGFTWEHDAHLYLKRLLSWSALLGGSGPYLEAIGVEFAKSVVHQAHTGSRA